MYLNSTTGLCQFCSDGEYYDYTFEVCRSCAGKCNGICQYQKLCYQCNSGQLYDLELLNCTSTCDSPKQKIVSSQYNSPSICRSTNYYIDPQSSQILELGTQKYPYKYARSAFSEILNQFSHSESNIIIYIKENTASYIEDYTTFLLNITSVTIQTYSDSSSTAGSATVIGTTVHQPEVNGKAQFSILNSTSINIDQAISKGNLSSYELNLLSIQVSTFFVCRTNFDLININGFRYSTDIGLNTFFCFFTSLVSRTVNIKNSTLSLTGDIFMTNDPVNANFESIVIDASKNEHGISFEISCDYPGAVLTSSANFNNITTYFSAKRNMYGWPTIIKYQGPGNFTSNNLDFSNYYSNYGEGKPTVFISSSPSCQPNDGVLQTVNMNNGIYSLKQHSDYISLYNSILINLDYNIYRKTIVNITNHNFYDYINASGLMIYATSFALDEFYYSNSIHTNFSSTTELIRIDTYSKVIISNITYSIGGEIIDHILDISDCGYAVIDTLKISNLNISRSSQVNLINLNNFQTTYTRINGLNATNIFTNYGTILTTLTSLTQIIIENCYFSYIFVDYDASVLFVKNSQSVIMQNFIIDHVLTLNPFDYESSFMHIMDLDLSGNLNTSIYNITYSNSQSSFVHILSVDNTPNSDIFLNIDSIKFINMSYAVARNIIEINQIMMEANLHLVFSNFYTENIKFETYGNFFKFGQHLLIPAVITNSTFTNFHSTSISIYPESKETTDIRTMLKIENTVFNNIDDGYESLLKIYQGSYLEIDNCTFTNIYSIEDAGVLYADYQDTNVMISNSVFKNNTAVQNSLFNVDFGGVLELHNCTIENNFSIIYGVALITGGSSILFYGSTIQNNYAIQLPVMFLYEGISTSIFDNCTISGNFAMTKGDVKTELFTVCTKLCFVHQRYKSYIQSNQYLLNFKKESSIIEVLVSTLNFQNHTTISNQDAIIISFNSNISYSDCIISDIYLSKTGMELVSSSLSFENTSITNVNNSGGINLILSMVDCSILISSSSLTSSFINFISSISTSIQINKFSIYNIISDGYFIECYLSSNISISDVIIQNSTTNALSLVYMYECSQISISNLSTTNILTTILYFKESNITSFDDISISGSNMAILVQDSLISSISNSRFNSNGNLSQKQGGALRSIDSSIFVKTSNFTNNTSENGGAISFECSSMKNCNLTLDNSIFQSNFAKMQGGAVYYNFARPTFNKVSYINNSAQYGPDIASYAVKLRFSDQNTDELKVTNMVSGIEYEKAINLALIDYDNQIMVLDSIHHVDFTPINNSAKVAGSNSALFKNGIATFNNIKIRVPPGSKNVLFQLHCKVIENSKIKQVYGKLISNNIVSADFRYCEPGEIQMPDNSCSVCQVGTYSLNWNSTECSLCPQNSVCLGGTQISLNSGYWRYSSNETYIVECLFKGACNGGYYPNNTYPIKCASGYTGVLCNECQTFNDK